MNDNRLDLIEKNLKLKNIQEYEILFIDRMNYETIFLKTNSETEREVNDFEYIMRILTQKGDQTGIGVVKGNSFDSKEISKNIEVCELISKNNISSKYHFPEKKTPQDILIAEDKILKDPEGSKKVLSEELVTVVEEQKGVVPTFGRFRIHTQKKFLRNSNGLDVSALKTFFFIEFSLKAEKNGKLSEFWINQYFKEKSHLDFQSRVEKWAKLARDNLNAKPPKPSKKATVVFAPYELHKAIIPVVGFHASGQALSQNLSSYKLDEEVASEDISVADNGLLEGGLSTNPWDGEGTPHQNTEIIRNGIFQSRIFDEKYAILENTESTGNGIRGISGAVDNGVSNFQIYPGDITLEEMISNIKEGYIIEKFSWLNPEELSGFFGAEIRNGYYIKNGEFKNPIKLGNVSGNVLEMIKNCQHISKETEFIENSLLPYIAFSNLTVSF
ncbi:MAG: TldD/PmbA family protein [Candidatus Lokiarchaeota archaeon]|nr:TldD/PmbA family protein [Candidatus Lokiarchaeota archaeon]